MTNTYQNISIEELIQEALNRNEGEIAANGALLVKTGKRTGRSPLDRFIVKDQTTESEVDWGNVNRPFEQEANPQMTASLRIIPLYCPALTAPTF